MTKSSNHTPQGQYQSMLTSGTINPDSHQAKAVEKLQSLYETITANAPPTFLEKLFGNKTPAPCGGMQGLYMYGGVGRGKSTLMDMFYDTLPTHKKQRVHFHEFMLGIHQTLHERRQKSGGDSDPLPAIATDIAKRYQVLCFDEFHITNITDAMILGRLFETLFAQGVYVVATSNWRPDDLYKDGLQRENFLPFIALLKDTLDILHLDSPTDFRLIHMENIDVFHSPLGDTTTATLHTIFKTLTAGVSPHPTELSISGRTLTIEYSAVGVGYTTFANLCQSARGAGDYLALAQNFKTLILDGVPVMNESTRNEAKRFMTLIDALYEHRINLIMGCDDVPEKLYVQGSHAFEFERTVSRLVEMQSAQYQQDKG